jgi:glycosyltransferase involved in cell wall biosynthesis
VQLDIYGTKEDPVYWNECCALMEALPANASASYCGELAPPEVLDTLARYDLFLFPTLGENFGHVILEALLAGCPILISDQSPWRRLEGRFAGLDLPLDRTQEFSKTIDRFVAMDAPEFSRWTEGARAFGLAYCQDADLVRPTSEMLKAAIGR